MLKAKRIKKKYKMKIEKLYYKYVADKQISNIAASNDGDVKMNENDALKNILQVSRV